LRLVLDADSPDIGNQTAQIDMMNRMKAPIANDCKTATSAEVKVFEQGRATGTFTATADGGWVFAAVPAASVPVAAKPEAEAKVATAPAQTPAAAPSPTPPAVTPTPASSPVVPPPSPVPVAAPQPPAPAPDPIQPLPRDTGYAAAFLHYVHDNPNLAQEDAYIRAWAAYRYPREYQQLSNQEFKVRPLLDNARHDLADTLAEMDPQRITLWSQTGIGQYDFAKSRFPVNALGPNIGMNRNWWNVDDKVPASFELAVSDIDVLTSLPMDAATAQSFIEKRTRWGSIDRTIWVVVTVKVDANGFHKNDQGWSGNLVAATSLENATFYADQKLTQPLYHVSEAEVAKLHEVRAAEKAAAAKAEADRQAEIARQQMLAQRTANIQRLSGATPSVKLANFISTGPVNFYQRLSNLRSARGAALILAKPIDVLMLVQTDSSGNDKVDTKWPSELQVTVGGDQPGFKSGEWYLVDGMLTVPDGDDVPPAQLIARTVYACQQPKCTEAMDAAAIVDRKLAAASH
jgi:hypothetical protein